MSERGFSFTIFFSLLGVGIGLGLVLAGLLTAPEVLRLFYQPSGLALLCGGLFAVLVMAFSLGEIQATLALIWDIFSGAADPDREGVLKECIMLATRSRESEDSEQKFYREIKPYLSHRMLREGLDLLVAAYPAEMIRETLQTRQQQEKLRYLTAEQLLQTLYRASWMLGLTGGVLGLLRTDYLKNHDVLPIFLGGIAVPVVLGLLLSVLFFFPLLRQIQVHHRDWDNYLDMCISGILLLQERHHAHYLETVLKAYLPPVPAIKPTAARPSREKKTPRRGFQQALANQQNPVEVAEAMPAPEAEIPPGHPLSVDELRRFRPIQRQRRSDE